MKVYIAGGMTGYEQYNYPAFKAAADAWRECGYDVETPFDANSRVWEQHHSRPFNPGSDKCEYGDPLLNEMFAEDIRTLATSDIVVLLDGWEQSRGVRAELMVATTLGKMIYTQAGRRMFLTPVIDWSIGRDASPNALDADACNCDEPDATTKPSNPKDIIGSDKLPLHLWPETATALGCLGMLDGMLKYGRSNFRAIGVRATIYVDACKRHLNAWVEGEDIDAIENGGSGLPHLAHALACIAIIIDAEAAGKLTDDRLVEGGYRALVEELTPHVARLKTKHADKAPKHYTIADTP